MFKNVLVGVDGRPNGRDAIALATRLMEPNGKLTLAHVHSGELRPSTRSAPASCREEREASDRLLEQAACGRRCEREAHQRRRHERGQRPAPAGRGAGRRSAGGRVQQPQRLRPGDARRRHARRAQRRPMRRCDRLARLRPALRTDHQGRGRIQRFGGEQAALAVARELAAQTNASLHALQVVAIMSYAYTGIVAPDSARTIAEMVKEANDHLRSSRMSRVERCTESPARSWPRSANRWTSCVVAPAATGLCAGWCSAAPPTTWSATHVARCSCFPARPSAEGTDSEGAHTGRSASSTMA